MEKGICPKSYGMNVAKMAGIPKQVIANTPSLNPLISDETTDLHHFLFL
jgi:DNA mismatch repair ATPase MutS